MLMRMLRAEIAGEWRKAIMSSTGIESTEKQTENITDENKGSPGSGVAGMAWF